MRQTLEVVKQLEGLAFKLTRKLDSCERDLKESHQNSEKTARENKHLKQQIKHLTAENERLKTANAILGSKDYRRETKLKINRLIKEVDSCIVQLSE